MKTPFLTASYKDDRAAAWLERRSRMKEYHLYEVFEYLKELLKASYSASLKTSDVPAVP